MQPSTSRRATAVALATFAMAVPVGLTAEPASAADYPASVERSFMKSCVKAGTKKGVSRKTAKRICKRAYNCIERNLTLEEFVELGRGISRGDKTPPHNGVYKRCSKQAAS